MVRKMIYIQICSRTYLVLKSYSWYYDINNSQFDHCYSGDAYGRGSGSSRGGSCCACCACCVSACCVSACSCCVGLLIGR
jgi:hypothetical protein